MRDANKLTRGQLVDFAARLRELRVRVEQALEHCLPRVDTAPVRLHEAMRYATLNGGKRVRACLVYAAGQAAGASLDALDAPACAVELVHSYSLVHDDLPCMDDDELRRGKPTCHRAYDEATALLVGDALQSLAFEILTQDPKLAGGERRLRMVSTLAQAIGSGGMAGGQAIDLESVGQKLTLPALEDMHRRKTGALIRAAIMLGAQACDTEDDSRMRALERYGEAIGLAFQIADDVLDVEGEAAHLGKNPGADQARAKPTYPALIGLEAAKTKARVLRETALESLHPLGDNGKLLAALADYIIERNQ